MPCPDESVFRSYVTRTLPEEEAERFEEHYFECEACWTRLQRTLELHGALSGDASASHRASRRILGGWPALAAAAAVAAMAVGLWAFLPENGPTVRGGADAPAPAIEANGEGFEAQWQAVAGADVYVVEVFSDAGELLFSRETRETNLSIGGAELPASGRPSFLRVQALDELRRVLADFPLKEVPSGTGVAEP